MPRRARAYTLLEILIVLAVLAGATIGVLRLFSMSDVKAEAQKEQRSISALVEAVRGVYAASPSYEGVDMSLVAKQASLAGVLRASGLPVSAFSGDLLTLRAATVRVPNDAFSITVGGLDRKNCAAVIPALSGETTQVATIGGGNIQAVPHRVPDGAAIAQACAGGFFTKGTGGVVLVYYRPRATGNSVARGPACAVSCSPQTETQTIACATGLVGQITQTRSDTCSTDACPVPIVGSWTTVSSSCAPPAAPVVPVVPPPPKDPPLACTPRVVARSIGCAAPQVGRIDQQQAITCDASGGQHVGPWTTVSSSCAPPPPACTPGVIQGSDACPAGAFGQVSWFQETTCVGGSRVVGAKTITGSSCAPIGTCRPSTAPDGQRNVACSTGQYGQTIQTLEKSSTCASATALPVWGPGVVIGSTGSCAACPSIQLVQQTQWVGKSQACPAGQTGSYTWQQEQQRAQSTSYDCSAAPTTLPAPTVSAWSAWADVAGATRNVVNTCAGSTCPAGAIYYGTNPTFTPIIINVGVGAFGGGWPGVSSTPPMVVTSMVGPTIAYYTVEISYLGQTQQFTVSCSSAGTGTKDTCDSAPMTVNVAGGSFGLGVHGWAPIKGESGAGPLGAQGSAVMIARAPGC
ncbi:MAG TPA: type II secretion system protein [Rhodanobacter sp.]